MIAFCEGTVSIWEKTFHVGVVPFATSFFPNYWHMIMLIYSRLPTILQVAYGWNQQQQRDPPVFYIWGRDTTSTSRFSGPSRLFSFL